MAINEEYQKASDNYAEQILLMDQSFKKSTHQLTFQRGQVLKTVPGFWAQCCFNHKDIQLFVDCPKTKKFIREYLIDLEVIFSFDDRFGKANLEKFGREG